MKCHFKEKSGSTVKLGGQQNKIDSVTISQVTENSDTSIN